MQRRSPTYELKFGLIGFAVGLSAVAGVALAHNIHHHARIAADSSSVRHLAPFAVQGGGLLTGERE